MTHNKMYREYEGYEDALYLTSDIVDALNELYDAIQDGESREEIITKLADIEFESYITKIKTAILSDVKREASE